MAVVATNQRQPRGRRMLATSRARSRTSKGRVLMERRRLGRTDLEVSRIGFGGMTIPQVDRDQAVATVHKALDLGVNFIDTARAYGNGDSESKIGEVMKTRRDECYLSSRSPKMDYEGMKEAIDQSLATLGVDAIDLYEPHDVSTTDKYEALMAPNGGIKALHEAKEAGKIRFLGVTGHNWSLMEKLLKSEHFDAALITYNIANREAEEGTIALALELGCQRAQIDSGFQGTPVYHLVRVVGILVLTCRLELYDAVLRRLRTSLLRCLRSRRLRI